jgi:hypothetical protein
MDNRELAKSRRDRTALGRFHAVEMCRCSSWLRCWSAPAVFSLGASDAKIGHGQANRCRSLRRGDLDLNRQISHGRCNVASGRALNGWWSDSIECDSAPAMHAAHH